MIGGSLKIYWSYSWFCVRFHFFIQTSFIVDTEGWYCVTTGNISFSSFRSLGSLLWILFLILGFLSTIVGSLRSSSFFFFLIWIIFLKVVSEEFFLTFGRWHGVKCVCKKVSVCLTCVFASRIDFSLNLVPLFTTVSKNAVSVSNVSAVNSSLLDQWRLWCLVYSCPIGKRYRVCSISKLLF